MLTNEAMKQTNKQIETVTDMSAAVRSAWPKKLRTSDLNDFIVSQSFLDKCFVRPAITQLPGHINTKWYLAAERD